MFGTQKKLMHGEFEVIPLSHVTKKATYLRLKRGERIFTHGDGIVREVSLKANGFNFRYCYTIGQEN